MRRPSHADSLDPSIDLARACLMLYVVGYLHLGGYVGDGNTHVGWASAAITQCVLGSFTFISGYLPGRRPLRPRLADWLRFYRQRLGWSLLIATALAWALLLSTTSRPAISDWTAIPAVCLTPILLLRVLDALPVQLATSRAIRRLSYCSFCAYLFHRLIYGGFERIFHFDQPLYHWLGLLLLALPAVLAFAVLAQQLYDRPLVRLPGFGASAP